MRPRTFQPLQGKWTRHLLVKNEPDLRNRLVEVKEIVGLEELGHLSAGGIRSCHLGLRRIVFLVITVLYIGLCPLIVHSSLCPVGVQGGSANAGAL